MNSSLLETLLGPGGLSVVFQPIFSVSGETRSVIALEALTRGPRGSLFERPDVLFEYVRLKRAECAVERECIRGILREFHALHLPQCLTVNVHASTLGRDPEFPRFLRRQCEVAEVPMSQIAVEIVEHAPAWNEGRFLEALAYLRAEGAKIALDDVGLGNSNYRMILDSQPDYFKLDGYIVRGCHSDRGRRAVLASVVRLARDLGSEIVAEGIEETDDLKVVTEMGITLIQGHIFSKALPAEELLASGVLADTEAAPVF